MTTRSSTRAVLSAFAAIACYSPELRALPLVGCSFGSDVQTQIFDVDSSSGQATNPRATGLDHVVGVAYSPGWGLLGLTNSAAFNHPASLFEIDVITGASRLVGPTGLTGVTEGDLAFDGTTGALYGLYRLDSGQRQLFSLSPSTGAADPFGTSLPGDPSAMAFDASGVLYVLDTSLQKLLRVDKSNGSVLSSVALDVSLGSAAGMAIDPADGTTYVADGENGGTDRLYRLNLSTGSLTEIGPTGLPRGVAGLTVVPDPSTAGLLAIACILALRRRTF